MSSTFHTTGMVLRVSHSGENDRRAVIYTHDHGKLEVFVKSARRIQSKLSPHLEPITLVNCYIARGRVDHLAGIERHERFPGVRSSLRQLMAALWAAELVDVLTRPDHPDPRIFRLLEMWMLLVEAAGKDALPKTFRLAFVAALFRYLGHGLQCEACVQCKQNTDTAWIFVARDGGVRCTNCRVGAAPGGIPMSAATRATLATLAAADPPRFEMDAAETFTGRIADALLDALLAEYLDRPLATDLFVSRLVVSLRR